MDKGTQQTKTSENGEYHSRFNGSCNVCGKFGNKAKFCCLRGVERNLLANSTEAKKLKKTLKGTENWSQDTEKETTFSFSAYKDEDKEEYQTTNSTRKVKWWLDSGATHHMINTDKYFFLCIILKNPIKINVAKYGILVIATKLGNISCSIECGKIVDIKYILFCEALPRNLLSCSTIDHSGLCLTIFNGKATVVSKSGIKVLTGRLVEKDLYKVTLLCNTVTANLTPIEENLWHRRYEHLNMDYIRELEKNNMVDGMEQS